MKNKTLVLGASDNPERFSCMAIKNLRALGHPVLAVGNKKGKVGDTEISDRPLPDDSIDTITMYLNAVRQKEYYDYIVGLKPRRIIFNPGAENEELANMAKSLEIQVIEACTLVMLRTGQY
jgi:hypothetical protein